MNTAATSCEAWVAGERLADTADAYLASTPTVLAGLSVTWGRDTSLDQPQTSSCTLTVADEGDDTDYLRLLHVGDTLDIYASGRIHTGGDPVEVAVDGSFETTAPARRVAAAGAEVEADTSHIITGTRNLAATLSGKKATLTIPPAPFGPTDLASEWPTVPTASLGEIWALSLSVTLGWWQRAVVSGAMFRNPADRAPHQAGPTVTVGPGDAATAEVAALDWTVTAADGLGWPGVTISVTDQSWHDTGNRWTGQTGTWTDVDPDLTWTDTANAWAVQPGTWAEWGTVWFDDLHVIAPATAQRRVLVFTGRITDLDVAWNDGAQCAITASDWTVELSNDEISDTPWPEETINARVDRVAAAASSTFTVDPDTAPGALQVGWRDVDAQPVMTLLTELAVTADAVLWPAFSSTRGFWLWMEDPAERGALGTLFIDEDLDLVEITLARPSTAVSLAACDFTADGVHWRRDTSDVITRVSVTWQEQTVDDDGNPAPTDRRILISHPDRLARYGQRSLDWSTQLSHEADAFDVANRLLARTDELDWHADGLQWDTTVPVEFSDAHRAVLLDLLDGTLRIGLPLIVNDMPGWAPSGPTLAAYLEGGQYSYEGGRWRLAVNVSPSPQLGASVLWFDLDPAWRWSDFDPQMTWQQLWGLTTTTASPRWRSLDSHPWSADTNTWTEYIS